MTLQPPFAVNFAFATNCIHSISRDSPREGDHQISNNQQISTPQQPLDSLRDPGNQAVAPNQHQLPAPPPGSSTKSASASSFHHQTAAPNQHQLPASTTRQQHQTSITFQFPPPGSSTTSASLQQGIQPTSC